MRHKNQCKQCKVKLTQANIPLGSDDLRASLCTDCAHKNMVAWERSHNHEKAKEWMTKQ